ncbi:glycosyltransferase [Pseudonocardia aurantiaca]|uniref:Glycosyltransferase family A protein n=1 Tax=Pseudonocardia aurantiaca TaxID=75290 RepID=A0ABW4FI36_9PSEU
MLPIPSVSVCIPVYKGEKFLAETIRSVLDQTYRDFELVVLDNASPDESGNIAHSFAERDARVRVERNPVTLSQPDNWNRVVELSRAPLVKVVCADDLLHPRCLEYQVAPMDADPGLALVASRRHMIDEQSRVIAPRRGLAGLTGVRTGVEVARRVVRNGSNPIGESNNVLFRREDFFTVGGWRGDRTYVMDLDLWLRLLQLGDFLGLPETLAAFRIGRGTVSSDNSAAIYEQQRTLIEELGDSPYFQVRGVDLTVGKLFAPAGRARRRALFAVSKMSAGKSDSVA